MRILIINYEFPPLGGGAGNASAQIARQLAGANNEVTVLTSYYRGLAREEEKDGYRIFRIWTLRRYVERCSPFEMAVFALSAIFNLKRVVNLKRPEIIIAFFGIPCGPAAWWAKKRFAIPYLISLRGGDVPGFSPQELRIYHFFTAPVIRYLWKEAAVVVANSQGLKKLAGRTYLEKEILVVPNGVDTDLFCPASDQKKDGQKILSCGRMRRQKGFSYLIEALADLPDKMTLELVGDGPLRGELEALAKRLGLQERITFTGWLSQEELIEKYRQANIFVLPSLDEGMPNVLLEAMACGLPVVATDVAGSCELVSPGINGLLAQPKDKRSLREAIERVLSDKSRMGKESQAKAARYSWSKVAQGYLKICRQAVKDV